MVSDDPRLGDIITPGNDGDIVLVGYPYDEGVKRNGGRVGAAGGPAAIRRHLKKTGTVLNPEYNIDLNQIKITDSGDIPTNLSLEQAHVELEKKVKEIIEKGSIPFVIGGGNDQSFCNASALMQCYSSQNVGVVNIDAHLDVRERNNGQVHSGSPFRLLLESDGFNGNKFIEFGAQGSSCSAVHAKYVQDQGGRIFWLTQDIRKNMKNVPIEFEDQVLKKLGDNVFMSFDLDSVQCSDAPGVSAPATVGLKAEEALQMCFRAGKLNSVKLFDLSEYNPAVEGHLTGRLVAHMFYHFALGVAQRKSK
eukprot:gb/GECH01000375.1/.p1 GENE.gb/GECH01000375.1/~~gb/GECH01000375.1/.p1  ORF type:complete len:306 (+),score=98.05 gb/GECH01000375.1/:1-918(+)